MTFRGVLLLATLAVCPLNFAIYLQTDSTISLVAAVLGYTALMLHIDWEAQ